MCLLNCLELKNSDETRSLENGCNCNPACGPAPNADVPITEAVQLLVEISDETTQHNPS